MSCTTCDAARIEEVTHLIGDPIPRAVRIVAKDDADDRKQDEDQRRERKDRVIGESRAELRRLVLQPLVQSRLEKPPQIFRREGAEE